MKKILIGIFIIFVVGLVTKNYFHAGFPYTHDGENHLARFANYKVAIKERQFPPRFAPNLMNHYGYPVFNYNYPLANILSLPFSLVKINYEVAFKSIVIGALLFGSIGVFFYLRSLRFSKRTAIVVTSFWVTMPYLLSLINFRGSIGEILAYALLPWIAWTIEQAKIEHYYYSKRFFFSVLLLTAYSLSHNVTVVFSLPLFLLLLFSSSSFSFKHIQNWLVTVGISIVASLWFWLPALAEMKEIIVGQSNSNNEFFKHFVTLPQLLFSPIQFGFSYPGSIDSLSFQLGSICVAGVLYFFCLLVSRIKNKNILAIPTAVYTSFGLVVLLILFQLPQSEMVWRIFNQAKFIQFPWRLTIFITVFSLPLLAYCTEYYLLAHKRILIAWMIFVFLQTVAIHPVDYFHKNTVDYDAFSATTSTQNENVPSTFHYEDISNWQPGPLVDPAAGSILEVTKWSGSLHQYSVTITQPTFITEPTSYFSGWETTISAKGSTPKQAEYNLETSKGLIGFSLEPGEYQISSAFTQNTPARWIGNMVSLVTILGLVAFFCREYIPFFSYAKK